MQFGRLDPAAILAARFPALHARLKAGGWRSVDGALAIDDGVWARLPAAEKEEAHAWARELGLDAPNPQRDADLQLVVRSPAVLADPQLGPALGRLLGAEKAAG